MLDPSDFENPPVPFARIVTYLCSLGAATGVFVGGLECLALSQSLPLRTSLGDFALLGVTVLAMDAIVGGLCAFFPALWAKFSDRLPRALGGDARLFRRYQVAFSLGVMLLAAFFLLPLARELWRSELPRGAIGMCFLVVLTGAMGWFNSGYWFRRWLVGAGPALGYRVVMPVLGVVFALVGALVRGPAGPTQALLSAAQPNLVLVTIDTLRRDHVGIYGSLVPTPTIDELGRAGLVFDDAITTIPETLPSHSAMLTGNQPARNNVLSNGDKLSRGHLTVTEQLAAAGYRTGAFVSSFAVDGATGLDQGFQVYDDDFFPWLRGLSSTRVARVVLPLLMRVANPTDFPFLLERSSPETLRRALEWSGSDIQVDSTIRPTFLWVHLFDPHAPYEPREGFPVSEEALAIDHRAILKQEPGYLYRPEEVAGLQELYRQECAYVDTQVKALLDGLKAQGLLEHAMVIVVADHGESLGQHNIYFNHHGIYDDVLRVPFVVWTTDMGGRDGLPANPDLGGKRFSRTVTTADVANTLLGYSGVSPLTGTQSNDLMSFVQGVENTDTSLTVQGRDGASLEQAQLCGVRSPNAKYVRQQDGTEHLFDLVNDPGELHDIGPEHPEALELGRAGTRICSGASGKPKTQALGADECARLQALGYTDGRCATEAPDDAP